MIVIRSTRDASVNDTATKLPAQYPRAKVAGYTAVAGQCAVELIATENFAPSHGKVRGGVSAPDIKSL